MNEGSGVVCCLCGYEPIDPGGIYSETFDAFMCVDCELVATRVLTSAAEAGRFSLRGVVFDVRRRATR